MHCVSRSSEEFKKLLSEIGGNPVSLGADVSLWQEANGIDKFPTKDELVKSINDKKAQPVKLKEGLAEKLTSKDVYGKQYIRRIDGSDTKFRILKNWKDKGTALALKLRDEYPGVITWKTINNEVIVTINPQMGLSFNKAEKALQTQDLNLSERLFDGKTESDSLSVLTKIAESNHFMAPVAKKFLNYAKHNNVKITIDDVESFKNDPNNPAFEANAYYQRKNNDIHLAKNASFGVNGSETVIIHEILHSITYNKLRDNSAVSKDFEKLYQHALTQLNKEDFYGLTNVDEFVVALFTSPRMINALKEINATKDVKKYKNLFQEIFDYILSLVNIGRTNSLYEEAFSAATNILNDYQESAQSMADAHDADMLYSKAESKETVKEREFKKQYVFLSRQIGKLERDLKNISNRTSPEYKFIKADLEIAKEQLASAAEAADELSYVALGSMYLDEAEAYINELIAHPTQYTSEKIQSIKDTIDSWDNLEHTSGRCINLRKKLFPFMYENNLKEVKQYDNSGKEITLETIDNQTSDIREFSLLTGSLSDSSNLLARTSGSIIKEAQNTTSTLNKTLEETIQHEVDILVEYAKNHGTTMDKIYDDMIQVSKNGSLQLTQKYSADGELNPNYDKIFGPNAIYEYRKFYIFYQSILKKAEANLPYKVGKFYMVNMAQSSFKSDLKRIIPIESIMDKGLISSEELLLDIVPEKFRAPIKHDKKSRNLGDGLLIFSAYANEHNELSKALPKVRLLQEQMLWKINHDGTIEKRSYTKLSNPKSSVSAEKSNVYTMVDKYVDMQLKGIMKVNTFKALKVSSVPILNRFVESDVKDSENNIIGYNVVHVEDLIDRMLKYNSLLRIGLSPVTAIANVLFGEASNFIEAVGGRHFNISEMNAAKGIFAKQIDYISKEHTSNIYKWLHRLNPLQELGDYDLGENLSTEPKKLTLDKVQEMMYTMQKRGELELQSTTMLAMLIHDGYMNRDGSNTAKGDAMTDKDATRMSDKIQRLNQAIHGRYSQREASTHQQKVWFRALIQFRKWIPAAVEARFGDFKYDNRLQVDVEGRYRTLKNKVLMSGSVSDSFHNMFMPILNSKKALESGKMTETEIYNMRKNMVEMITLLSIALMAAALKAGTDDDRKRKLKNPVIKAGLTMLNRVSGDMMFFYNPANVSNLAKNAIPVGKLISDIIDVGLSLPHAFYLGDYKVKRGSLKGTNEFYSKRLPKIIPIAAPVAGIQRIFNATDMLPELN